MEFREDETRTLKLSSPGAMSSTPLLFTFTRSNYKFQTKELLATIRLALTLYPEVKRAFLNDDVDAIISSVDPTSWESITELVANFNRLSKTIAKLWSGATKPGMDWGQPLSRELFHEVWTRAFNRAVEDPKALNKHYDAFSNETYGETTYAQMQQILEELKPTSSDVFVDMGSGIGQLVIHVAGSTRVKKAVGIECASLPQKYARILGKEFKSVINWCGKKCRPYKLEEGSFLDNKYRKLIMEEATIIFINNLAMEPWLNAQIKQELFSELADGTRIISTVPFARPNRNEINARHLNDFAAIADVVVMKNCDGDSGSWTSKPVPYYLHTVNSEKLVNYFKSRKSEVREPKFTVTRNRTGTRCLSVERKRTPLRQHQGTNRRPEESLFTGIDEMLKQPMPKGKKTVSSCVPGIRSTDLFKLPLQLSITPKVDSEEFSSEAMLKGSQEFLTKSRKCLSAISDIPSQ